MNTYTQGESGAICLEQKITPKLGQLKFKLNSAFVLHSKGSLAPSLFPRLDLCSLFPSPDPTFTQVSVYLSSPLLKLPPPLHLSNNGISRSSLPMRKRRLSNTK